MNFSQCIKDSMEEAMSGVKNGEYAVKIYGPDINKLESLADEVSDVLRTVPGIVDIAHDNLTGQPQLTIEIDRERAARHGISTSDILDIVETSIGGKAVTRVIDGERRFDVVLRAKEAYRGDYTHVGDLLVSSPSGVKIPLRQLAKLKMVEGANSILRESNKRRIAVYSNIRGRDLGSAVLETQQKIKSQIALPAGYSLSYAGEFTRAEAAGKTLAVVVPVTLLLIFTLLYFAFDSAELALLTMTAVPVAAAVALVVLFVSGTHVSISSGVGLIALFGLSIQNAVIIVSAMRDILQSGDAGVEESIALAARNKLNAVLIAALVAAVGLAPAALSNGIGSQSQKPFAIVISCGILPATILTLFLLPVVAKYIVRRKKTLAPETAEAVVAN